MAAVKIVLRTKVNKDGTSPLALRITKDRKSSFLYLGYNLFPDQWDAKNQRVKKSHSNSVRLNNFLLKKLSEANDSAIELETEKETVSSVAVKQKIKPAAGAGFFAQADLYILNLRKAGKYNRVSSELPRINRFKEFLNGSEIRFSDITVQLLDNFKAYLLSTRKINERTAINHLSVIRSVFSQAKKSDESIVKHYPFGKGKIVIKFPDSVKIGLNPDEVKAIEALDLSHDSIANHSRNVWLFSYYFAGMRISDVLRLRWSDFQNDRLYYSMGKNTKAGSLKIPEKALRILDHYSPGKEKDGLVFPDLSAVQDFENKYEVQRKINIALSRINKHLKKVVELSGLEKKLTTHIARHTFGNISGDKISIQMLQKLYRHSSVTTTIGYQSSFIHKDADEALDAVLKTS